MVHVVWPCRYLDGERRAASEIVLLWFDLTRSVLICSALLISSHIFSLLFFRSSSLLSLAVRAIGVYICCFSPPPDRPSTLHLLPTPPPHLHHPPPLPNPQCSAWGFVAHTRPPLKRQVRIASEYRKPRAPLMVLSEVCRPAPALQPNHKKHPADPDPATPRHSNWEHAVNTP